MFVYTMAPHTLISLPDETLQLIASWCDVRNVKILKQTCRRFNTILDAVFLKQNMQFIKKMFRIEDFPCHLTCLLFDGGIQHVEGWMCLNTFLYPKTVVALAWKSVVPNPNSVIKYFRFGGTHKIVQIWEQINQDSDLFNLHKLPSMEIWWDTRIDVLELMSTKNMVIRRRDNVYNVWSHNRSDLISFEASTADMMQLKNLLNL